MKVEFHGGVVGDVAQIPKEAEGLHSHEDTDINIITLSIAIVCSFGASDPTRYPYTRYIHPWIARANSKVLQLVLLIEYYLIGIIFRQWEATRHGVSSCTRKIERYRRSFSEGITRGTIESIKRRTKSGWASKRRRSRRFYSHPGIVWSTSFPLARYSRAQLMRDNALPMASEISADFTSHRASVPACRRAHVNMVYARWIAVPISFLFSPCDRSNPYKAPHSGTQWAQFGIAY